MESSSEGTSRRWGTWAATAVRMLLVVAINAVPIWGLEDGGWSPGTILALYWLQTVIGIPLTVLLIILHRRVTHKMGHYSLMTIAHQSKYGGTVQTKSGFLSNFVTVSLFFAIAHGVFLFFILFLVWRNAAGAVNPADVVSGLKITAALMALSFGVDVLQLPGSSFAWIRQRAEGLLRRVFLVHMVIILGMGIAAFSTQDAAAFFIVFLVLKLIADLAGELPEWVPKEPPAWIARLGGEKFGDAWRDAYKGQLAAMVEAERTFDPKGAGDS